MKGLVSVLIPTYNREKYILKTLDSVLDQLHRPIEIVIVDDGSTDNTLQKIKFWKSANSTNSLSVNVITQPNSGAPTARNKALSAAQGEFIQYLDSDDILSNEKISKQYAALRDNQNIDYAICDFDCIDDKGRQLSSHSNKMINITLGMCIGRSIAVFTPLIRRRLLKENSLFWTTSIKEHQDIDFLTRVAIVAKGCLYTPGTWCHYRKHHDAQISDQYLPFQKIYIIDRCKSILNLLWKNRSHLKPGTVCKAIIAIMYLAYLSVRMRLFSLNVNGLKAIINQE